MRGKIHDKSTIKGDQFYLEHISHLIDQQMISSSKNDRIVKLAGHLIYNTFHFYPDNLDNRKKNLICPCKHQTHFFAGKRALN